MSHPIQPLVKDAHGVLRFKENAIVNYLLDFAQTEGRGLNALAEMDFSKEDWQQFAQLIGCSLSGYSDLSYVDQDTVGIAERMANGKTQAEAENIYLKKKLRALRDGLRKPIAELYDIHPDNLSIESKEG